jgi:hypothetical protein
MNALKGSHRVDFLGDRVVIRDLGLFCGFHRKFDRPGSKLERFDAKRIEEIVGVTRDRMAIGQFPQVIERHTGKDNARPECCGRVVAVRADHTADASYLRGDVEMSREDFESRIKSNRWCRRSAQIWPDGHFSEVSLLGNETPARPLEDTHFEREGEPLELVMDGAVHFDLSSAPTVPELLPTKKGKRRKDDDMDEDTDKVVAQKDAEIGALTRQRDDFQKASESARSDFEKAQAAWNAERADFQKRLEAIETEAKRLDCEKLLGDLERDGFAYGGDVRQEMFDRLMSASDRAKEVAWIRKTGRKVPLGDSGRINTSGTKTGGSRRDLDAETVAKFQKQAEGDAAKYRELVEKHIAG